MKLAFSTLGCPSWGLREVAAAAARLGYRAVELRCLGGDLDLLRRPELRPGEAPRTRRFLAEHGVEVACVDASSSFHDPDGAARQRAVDDALRHADLAAALGAPLVRVFPNEVPAGSTRSAVRARIGDSLRSLGERLPPGVRVALETHGDFAAAAETRAIVGLADHPAVGVVWDVANTTAAGDDVDHALAALADRLLLVHVRDARPVPGEPTWRPVLAGRGEVPLAGALAALRRSGYAGAVSFEWEKYWRPDLEEPEVALADFARWVHGR